MTKFTPKDPIKYAKRIQREHAIFLSGALLLVREIEQDVTNGDTDSSLVKLNSLARALDGDHYHAMALEHGGWIE